MLKNRSKISNDTKNKCLINGVCYKCRTCFDPVHKVYSLKEESSKTNSWHNLLREVPQLKTNEEELLPNSICSKCLDKMNKCYEFILQINNANKKYLELLSSSKDPFDNNCLSESSIDLPMNHTLLPKDKTKKEDIEVGYDISSFINEVIHENNCLSESSIDLPMKHTLLPEVKTKKEEIEVDNGISSSINEDDDNFSNKINEISMEFGSSSSSDEWDDTPATSKQLTDENDIGEIQKVDGRFICPVCNKSYLSKQNCRRHLHYLHLKPDNFPCEFCETNFSCKAYLNAHLKRMHPGETLASNDKQRQQNSGIQPTEQQLESENTKQNKSKSNTTDKEIQNKALCPFCGSTFSSNHNLDFHIKIHTGERPFKCDFCEKSFTRNAGLKEHRRMHTGERPYQCPYCEKAFTMASKLNIHKRLHTGEFPYKCTFCEKRFNTSESYKLHTRIHTGEKPYKCEICFEAFAGARYLRHHRIKKGHGVEKNEF